MRSSSLGFIAFFIQNIYVKKRAKYCVIPVNLWVKGTLP